MVSSLVWLGAFLTVPVLGEKKQFHGFSVSRSLWAEESRHGLCSLAHKPEVDVAVRYAFGRKGLFTPVKVPVAYLAAFHDEDKEHEPDREFSFPALGSMATSAAPLANKLLGSLLRLHLLTTRVKEACKDGRHDQAPLRLSQHEEKVRQAIGNPKAEFAAFNLLTSRLRWDFIFDEDVEYPPGALFCRALGHEHPVPVGFKDKKLAAARNAEVHRAWEKLQGNGDVQGLFAADPKCEEAAKHALCLEAFPVSETHLAHAHGKKPFVEACEALQLCVKGLLKVDMSLHTAVMDRIGADCVGVSTEHTKLLPVYSRGLETLHVDDGKTGSENGIYDIWPAAKRNGAFIWKQRLGWMFIHRQSDGCWQLDDHRWGGHGFAISNEADEDWPDVLTWVTLDNEWDYPKSSFTYRSIGGRVKPSWVSRWDMNRPIRLRNASAAPKKPDLEPWFAKLEGVFDPVPGAAANGWPVWQRRGMDAFLLVDWYGFWLLSDSCWKWGCDEGNLTSGGWVHGPPPSVKQWWYASTDDIDGNWTDSGAHFEWVGGEGEASRLYAETLVDDGLQPAAPVQRPFLLALLPMPGLLFLAWRRRERPAALLDTEGCA